jgi:hypothetical protein
VIDARSRDKGLTGFIIDQLGIDLSQAAKNVQARHRWRACYVLANAPVAPLA